MGFAARITFLNGPGVILPSTQWQPSNDVPPGLSVRRARLWLPGVIGQKTPSNQKDTEVIFTVCPISEIFREN